MERGRARPGWRRGILGTALAFVALLTACEPGPARMEGERAAAAPALSTLPRASLGSAAPPASAPRAPSVAPSVKPMPSPAPPPVGAYDGLPLPRGERVDRLVAFKAAHRLEAYASERLLKTYRIAIGSGGAGPKRFEGDRKTPEGRYTIPERHRSPRFHLFLHVSYPNSGDRAAHRAGLEDGSIPAGVGVGGAIGIHGERRKVPRAMNKLGDWTAGCIAVDDDEIEELYRAVVEDAAVDILP